MTCEKGDNALKLHEKIKAERIGRGWTQEKLAQLCGGVATMSISRWENGEVVPQLENLKLLAAALGKPLEWFQDDNEEAGPPIPDDWRTRRKATKLHQQIDRLIERTGGKGRDVQLIIELLDRLLGGALGRPEERAEGENQTPAVDEGEPGDRHPGGGP